MKKNLTVSPINLQDGFFRTEEGEAVVAYNHPEKKLFLKEAYQFGQYNIPFDFWNYSVIFPKESAPKDGIMHLRSEYADYLHACKEDNTQPCAFRDWVDVTYYYEMLDNQ